VNYNEFLKAVDEKLSIMTETEKNQWIHNMARTTKDHKRTAFLKSLQKEQACCPDNSIKKEIEDWCRKIEEQEIYFECSGYEEYGESYWDSDYSYEYSDAFGIGKELSRAFQVTEDLMFQKEYKQASELFEKLCNMTFTAIDNDAGERQELELKELLDEKLVSLDLKKIALNLMYAKYQAAEGGERVVELYRYFSWDMCKGIKVEDFFIVGPEELKEIDVFMEEWISFLKNTEGDMAGDLLSDACIYQGGVGRLCETAREVSVKHPVLYEYACQQLLNEKKEIECEKLGLESIRILPQKLVIRGKIADLTAKAARQMGHENVIKECYEVAFHAESTLNHYLRLFELPDYKEITDRAAIYANALPENSTWERNNNRQLLVNYLSKEHKKVIRFFNGEFDYIFEDCKKDKTELGWSSQFKGIAIPLFILLLNQNRKLTKAGQRLVDGIEYRLGFKEGYIKSFTDRFFAWKEKVVFTNEQYEKYAQWLEKEVDRRTEAVVGGGHRKSYYKAAVLIAAFGEALESNGKLHGRMALIEYYKKMYSRKSAFRAEFEMLNEK